MVTLRDILAGKGSLVLTIAPSSTVMEAVYAMNDHGVGALVVTEGGGVVGIFTERDVLRRVVGEGRRPEATLVQEVMTSDVLCCPPDTLIDEASRVMKDRRVRHLPVCTERGQLLGLVSIGDINAHHASAQAAAIHYLQEYVYGAAA